MTTVTIGNFDGIHLGHQEVMKTALSFDGDSVMFYFEPISRQYFSAGPWRGRLTTPHERTRILRNSGIGNSVCLPFDSLTAEKGAEEFLRGIEEAVSIHRIVVGYDFHFGAEREGTVDYLKRWCTSRGIDTIIVPPLRIENGPVKSERIRSLLKSGDIELAGRLLGRPYSSEGPASRGKGAGRTLGFPTINVRVPECKLLPEPGSYAGKVYADGCVSGLTAAVFVPDKHHGPVEAHVIGRDIGDIYGSLVRVEFRKRMRDVAESVSFDRLRELIAEDVEKIREYDKEDEGTEESE
mgnify:CR=1 FL=1